MRKFLPLLLCLSLSIFTVARAAKLTQVFAPEPDEALVNDASTEEETPSDNDHSAPGASNDDDEDVNDDDGDDATGDNGTGSDDGEDEDGDDGGGGDQVG
jgi:hypothetical protein